MTVSVGVASLDTVVQDKAALVDAADQALYCAKQQGRNRVTAARHDVEVVRQEANPKSVPDLALSIPVAHGAGAGNDWERSI